MKITASRIMFLIVCSCFLFFTNCTPPAERELETKPEKKEIPCGMKGDKQLYKGINGGCFYYNKKGNRTYINRMNCKC